MSLFFLAFETVELLVVVVTVLALLQLLSVAASGCPDLFTFFFCFDLDLCSISMSMTHCGLIVGLVVRFDERRLRLMF